MLDSRLRYVVAVARSGSFTAAARDIGLTQSGITKSIADLEREVGYAIFHRTSRGVTLTERGRFFVDRASRLLEDANDLLRGGARQQSAYAGTLRIGVGPASLEWRLADPLIDLLRLRPEIRYEILSSNFESIVQQLRAGALDVAVGFDAAFGEWPDLRREPMGQLEVALFVRLGHSLLERNTLTVAALSDFDFVSPTDSRPYGEIIRGFYADEDDGWRFRVHKVDHFPIVQRIVANSDAIGVVSARYAQSAEFCSRFALLEGLHPWPPAPLCCAVRKRWEPKPAVRAFISSMKQSLPRH